ncbi:Gti1/Pac2 family-domain-containing protein [Xylaria acuta]|nr:Gti1/Pac2 family-domain-containing protein [Xylaria acuta]
MPNNQETSGAPLYPTFEGFIGSTMDALILFEASLSGVVTHVPRRPHDRERSSLIRSGHVFIYEEHSSGIKRWTDGVPWSPSRILGNFLLYRELDKPFQPGEKKRAMKRNKTEGVTKPPSNHRSNSTSGFAPSGLPSQAMTASGGGSISGNEDERAYVGSLVDSYQFRDNGLIKKTISVTHKGIQHHLVSYYSLADVKTGRLRTVRNTSSLRGVVPSQSLLQCGSFRAPIDDNDFGVLDTTQQYMVATPAPAPTDYTVLQNLPPNRSLSIPPTQPYGNTQAWGTQQYGHNPDYNTAPQMLQPTPTGYGHPQLMSYPYEVAYASSSRASNFNPAIQPTRRHSVVPNSNGASQLEYSAAAPLLTNGSGLTTHGLSGDPYINGEMFGVSAANAAAESSSADTSGGNDAAGTIDQSNGTNGLNTPVPHNASGFDGPLSNGYENPMNQLAMANFGGPLQDSAGSNFGATGPGTSPASITLGLNHTSGMSPPEMEENPEEMEWNRTMTKNGDQW